MFRPSQASGVLPNALERRLAISAEMPRCPFTSSDRALRETPSAFALSVTLNPKGSVQGTPAGQCGLDAGGMVQFS